MTLHKKRDKIKEVRHFQSNFLKQLIIVIRILMIAPLTAIPVKINTKDFHLPKILNGNASKRAIR